MLIVADFVQNGFFFVESKWILGHPGVDGKRRQDLAPCVLAIHHQVTFLLGAMAPMGSTAVESGLERLGRT